MNAGERAMLELIERTAKAFDDSAPDSDSEPASPRVSVLDEIVEEAVDEPPQLGSDRRVVLADLGYLADEADPEEDAIAAHEELLAEAHATPEFRHILKPPEGAEDDEGRDEIGEEALYDALSSLLSFDGGKDMREAFSRLPDPEERSTWSRVVKARLLRLAMPADSIPAMPWGPDDAINLRYLAETVRGVEGAKLPLKRHRPLHQHYLPDDFPEPGDDDWVGISGDARMLLDLLRLNPIWRTTFFIAKSAGDSMLSARNYWLTSLNAQGELRFRRNGSGLKPKEHVEHPGNRLGVRLIKIRMWQLGYYRGDLLTSVFEPGIRSLFLDLVKADEVDANAGKLRPHMARSDSDQTLIFISPHSLHPKVIQKIDAARDDPEEAVPAIEKYLDLAKDARVKSEEIALPRFIGDLRKHQTGRRPRIFSTPLRMIRLGLHAGRRMINNIWDTLGNVINSLRNLLAAPIAAFRRLARTIGRAARQFLYFVIGRPIGVEVVLPSGQPPPESQETLAAIVTRFGADRDAISYFFAPSEAQAQLTTRYRRLLHRLTTSLRVGLRVAQIVLIFVVSPALGLTTTLAKLAFQLLGELRTEVARRTALPEVPFAN